MADGSNVQKVDVVVSRTFKGSGRAAVEGLDGPGASQALVGAGMIYCSICQN